MDSSSSSPPPAPAVAAPKSPPLAFEKTPNDTIQPLTSPSRLTPETFDGGAEIAPSMGPLSSSLADEIECLRAAVQEQTRTIGLLYEAHAAERRAWELEKDNLHHRIASFEKLLKTGDSYSPAKSPVFTPTTAGSLMSPLSKKRTSSNRLASIAEDENRVPLSPTSSLSQRREGAPQSIDIPEITNEDTGRRSSVGFEKTPTNDLKVEEIPFAPSHMAGALSPSPFSYRVEAGHTPLRAPRQPTPPQQDSMSMDGIDDTPTRNNTHINTYLTRSNDEESEKELEGPLNMPELPHDPSDTNFTAETLSKKLEPIAKHPAEYRPMVLAHPSPGLASPAEPEDEFVSPKTVPPNTTEGLNQLHSARNKYSNSQPSDRPSNAILSSNRSTQGFREERVQSDFEFGGIRLKKKPSTNFGAPIGQLADSETLRKLSETDKKKLSETDKKKLSETDKKKLSETDKKKLSETDKKKLSETDKKLLETDNSGSEGRS